MNRRELERSWKTTITHLEAAKGQLPQDIQPVSDELVRYEEWLSHNELELALDELIGIGEELACSNVFWSELHSAAKNMSLPNQSRTCERYVESGE